MARPPQWQLPPGVAPGTWDYVHSPTIAASYGAFLAASGIEPIDWEIVRSALPPPAPQRGTVVADFGCGSGRTLLPLAAAGYAALGIDLSQAMLEALAAEARQQGLPVALLRANLVQLQCLADASVDHGVCLFSTLGMIQGRLHRRGVLRHMARIVRPGGRLILHVHNRWAALADPGGPAWLASSYWRSIRRAHCDPGDRVYAYRGLADMFLHSYSRRELLADLRSARLRVVALHPLNRRADAPLPAARWLPMLRAGGYIAVCTQRN